MAPRTNGTPWRSGSRATAGPPVWRAGCRSLGISPLADQRPIYPFRAIRRRLSFTFLDRHLVGDWEQEAVRDYLRRQGSVRTAPAPAVQVPSATGRTGSSVGTPGPAASGDSVTSAHRLGGLRVPVQSLRIHQLPRRMLLSTLLHAQGAVRPPTRRLSNLQRRTVSASVQQPLFG